MSLNSPTLNEEQYEEPEGLDDDIDLENYPLDSVLIRNESRTVHDVVRRIKANQYTLDPEFQRDFVWDEEKQSRLIESALMRIPLPVFYLAENEDGKITVVDGLQRLTTFHRYLNNEFALKGKGLVAELQQKKFNNLSPKFQTRLEDTQLILFMIDSKAPERARLDIFERVNSGTPLSRQQMRNALYMGQATRWLKEQSNQDYFLKATGSSLNPKPMRDREVINRFCGFSLLGVDYYSKDSKGDMDAFLADTLKHMNKKMKPVELTTLAQRFATSMRNNYTVFKGHAFRKHTQATLRRSVLNVALFDVFSVMMAGYNEQLIANKATSIQQKFFALMNDERFLSSITLGTNEPAKVRIRFRFVREAFQDL